MRRHRHDTPARIDLTPLFDTVFLLIIILMCTLIHMRVIDAVRVARPVVSSGSAVPDERRILQVVVDDDGNVSIAGESVELDSLASALQRLGSDSDACLISADRQARHGRVTQVMVAARAALGEKPLYIGVETPCQRDQGRRR